MIIHHPPTVVVVARVSLFFIATRPGKNTKNYGNSPFLIGKLTISTGPCSIAM